MSREGTGEYPPKYGTKITRSARLNARVWYVIGCIINHENNSLIINSKRYDNSGNKLLMSIDTNKHKFWYI